ncbi:MAG: hypothetical protein HY912_23660 [Desulfomonile tiedjei]|uniref:Thioredoxin-like fold domain-containing protein n=1 Tax=Desulfomonile tiedjei TaxID=2358 RepID=A0A9D6V601_9BACT|nr:hypothetical protein [Desulfomonile tiedjei]
MERVEKGGDIQVRILCSEGCANTSPTVSLVKNIARALDISVNIEMIVIRTQEEAQELHFLGSPTVQIDGLDIEPSARESAAYGLT